MKPRNFPARKAMRLLDIEGRRTRFCSDEHRQAFADHYHESIEFARAIRTKKNRQGRA